MLHSKYIKEAYVYTDPHDKSHCVVSVHPPGLEESINEGKRRILSVKVCFLNLE